jgi:hypothetical protein
MQSELMEAAPATAPMKQTMTKVKSKPNLTVAGKFAK